jgi:HAD superfamily hydrolase (TIGR01549 family)
MIKSIFFDLDDTLWKSFKPGLKRYRLLAEELSLKKPSLQEFSKMWGYPFSSWIQSMWPGIDEKAFAKAYKSRFGIVRHDLFPGVKELLPALSEKGIVLGLLSSRQSDSLVEKAQLSGLDLGLFRFIFTEDKLEFKKPDARAFEKPLQELANLGISREQTIYVGDHLGDYLAANGAGLEFFAVLTGVTSRKEFLSAGLQEKKILDSVKDLPRALNF